MFDSLIATYQGIRFRVEAVPSGDGYEGRFTLSANADAAATSTAGTLDAYRPTTENLWATQQEALNYATEAAHHAIEGIQPFTGRGRGTA